MGTVVRTRPFPSISIHSCRPGRRMLLDTLPRLSRLPTPLVYPSLGGEFFVCVELLVAPCVSALPEEAGSECCLDGSCPDHGTQPLARRRRRPRECPCALLPESLRLSHRRPNPLSVGRVGSGGVLVLVCSLGICFQLRRVVTFQNRNRVLRAGSSGGLECWSCWLVWSLVWSASLSAMPDYGERPAEENERRLETASCRDPPTNNYGAQMLERTLPPQQQQPSGGRKMTGGIMRLANYRGWTVNIRAPKWKDNQLWINSEDLEAAQYIADAAFHFTGRPPVHFPHVEFEYLPLLLSTGERLTTREKCSAYVAKIAKGPALLDRRKDFKERAQKLIYEMVKRPEVLRFLSTVRASPRQAWQPRPEANPFNDDENGMAMEADTSSEEANQALPSTVAVNPSQYGSLVPVAEVTHSVIADDGGEENGTLMEVDSLSEKAIQALAPTGTVDFASVFQFDSAMTSFYEDVNPSTSFIPGFEIDLPENFLTSAGQSLGIWHPLFGEKKKEDLVPDNCKELLASLDKEEEEILKSIRPLDMELWSPHPPFVPQSPLLATTLSGSGWQSRGTTSGAGADETLRPPVRPILYQNRWRP